jgi:hypothetical protein
MARMTPTKCSSLELDMTKTTNLDMMTERLACDDTGYGTLEKVGY